MSPSSSLLGVRRLSGSGKVRVFVGGEGSRSSSTARRPSSTAEPEGRRPKSSVPARQPRTHDGPGPQARWPSLWHQLNGHSSMAQLEGPSSMVRLDDSARQSQLVGPTRPAPTLIIALRAFYTLRGLGEAWAKPRRVLGISTGPKVGFGVSRRSAGRKTAHKLIA